MGTRHWPELHWLHEAEPESAPEFYNRSLRSDLSFGNVLPAIRHFFRRDELLVVGDDRDVAADGHEIAELRIDQLGWNVEHFLLGHPKDVEFFLVRKILVIEVGVGAVHIPTFRRARFELKEKALILLDRSEFLHLHVDERIFLLEAIAHHFNDGAFHGAENAELSFLFGL